jgi:hypothetical protein
MATVTIAVNFKSSRDQTGKYKKIVINVTGSSLEEVTTKVEQTIDSLHDIDNRSWSWSFPYQYLS